MLEVIVGVLRYSKLQQSLRRLLDGCRMILLILTDLHKYMLAYESLRLAVQRCRVPAEDDDFRDCMLTGDLPLLRCWLGLSVHQPMLPSLFFGDENERLRLIEKAENALEKKLSDFQRDCILRVCQPVTAWGFIAGAGKTLMLMILAKIAISFSPGALVWFVASTNRVVAEFAADAQKYFTPDEVLHLQVLPSEDGVVDQALRCSKVG